ncbi:unnamed protein product [Cuscuta epithymum]|uniref:C3H1-type domain-containing protein n=1 Tax=Cuscuta epithymum TaxID=186058 RepID=A0AAV0DFA9_9ASTE|nr:unnamed protein product [Cuscuta epithymum]
MIMETVCTKDRIFQLSSDPRRFYFNNLDGISPKSLDLDTFLESPATYNTFGGSNFRKFLPYNNLDDDEDDPFAADLFRMYDFKVRRCTRSRSHDWTDCPFAHPGEKARRRDPRKFHYSGAVCSEFRKGNCSRGDNCEFAHGVFECWLHPARYRTEPCKDGRNCKRKVCFFAHTSRQLRVLPVNGPESSSSAAAAAKKKYYRNLSNSSMYCHSPTSTLMGIPQVSPPSSPSLSPPMSPAAAIPFCRCCGVEPPYGVASGGHFDAIAMLNYKNALTELAKQVTVSRNINRKANLIANIPSVNVGVNSIIEHADYYNKNLKSCNSDLPGGRINCDGGEGKYNNDGGLTGIDLGWVNDLLT